MPNRLRSVSFAFVAWLWMAGSVSPLQAQPSQPVTSPGMEIRTTPPGAEIYLNWDLIGTTPLLVSDRQMQPGDLFVAWLPDHRASYRDILEPRSFYLRLDTEPAYSARRLLLRVVGGDEEWVEALTAALSGGRFFVHPPEDTDVLERRVLELGNRSPDPLLAWARSHFQATYWLVVRFPHADPRLDLARRLQSEDAVATASVDEVSPPSPRPEATSSSAEITSPTETSLELRLIDLRTASETLQVEIPSQDIDHSEDIDHSDPLLRSAARELAIQGVMDALTDWAAGQEASPEVVSVVDADDGEDVSHRGDEQDTGSAPQEPNSR